MILEIKDGTVSKGGNPILTHFDFYIKGTENIAVVGKIGAGKTTLLELLAGKIDVDRDDKSAGRGVVTARNITRACLTQQTNLPAEKTLEEYMNSCAGMSREEYIDQQKETKFKSLLTGFGIPLSDRSKTLSQFSGGEQKKIQLLGLLLEEPDILLLDEPTNHLDIETCAWLEEYLKSYKKAVVIVSHDRYFIDNTADIVWEVSGGKLKRYAGNYSAYRKELRENYSRQMKAYEAQQAEIKREKDLIEKFKHKPKKASFAKSRVKMLERMEKIEKPVPDDAFIHTEEIFPMHRGPKWVYHCEELAIGYEKDTPIQNITCRIKRGSKLAVIGENGSGKSTFLQTIAGNLMPLKGKSLLGNNIDMGYFDQKSGEISSDQIVIDWFHDRFPAMKTEDVRKTLAGYLFKGDDMGKPVSKLSGGEKARLVLASVLEEKPNFLVLDEPTNNMDIPAKETIESILKMYKGTILLVSHDRYLISEVCDSLLIFEKGAAEVLYYPFDYRHYMAKKEMLALGEDMSVVRSAEEQRLIDGLRSVPKGERHRLREFSTSEQILDWEFDRNRETREAAEEAVLKQQEMMQENTPVFLTLEEYMNSSDESKQEVQRDMDAAEEALTKELLDWYDLYMDSHPEN